MDPVCNGVSQGCKQVAQEFRRVFRIRCSSRKISEGRGGFPLCSRFEFQEIYIYYIHTPKLFTCMYVCMYVCMIIFYKPFSLHETPIS